MHGYSVVSWVTSVREVSTRESLPNRLIILQNKTQYKQVPTESALHHVQHIITQWKHKPAWFLVCGGRGGALGVYCMLLHGILLDLEYWMAGMRMMSQINPGIYLPVWGAAKMLSIFVVVIQQYSIAAHTGSSILFPYTATSQTLKATLSFIKFLLYWCDWVSYMW